MSNSVLVVEDNQELRTLIDRMLSQRGYEVHCAATVSEALAMLNEAPAPCLVLWDPTTLPLSGSVVTLAGRLGVHIATIPIGIMAAGQTREGLPIIAKKLTSTDAILSVLREHCPGVEEHVMV
jgi:CheY-like chemotaxis protein